jgi:DNA invertase Pin-like site-specific DNA recombinase
MVTVTTDIVHVESTADIEIPVAQYVRMSTEHQRYSTENQQLAIADYALVHGMRIVKTYADAGKSGLNIGGRLQLQQLLADVQKPDVGFRAILVYDVSRWGRFPDPDEAAMYEQTCKKQGIQVIYCAEQFNNDGSLQSTIIKNIKRSMAAEYARELSVKVFAGQRTLIKKGYRQGGTPGYGLRRQLIDEHHNAKSILKRGEHKSIQTDRILLIPGPPEEIETVNFIYHLFLKDGLPERTIATILNNKQIVSETGRSWTRGVVHQILTNEKYIGNNVFNRTSFKLKIKHQQNDPADWIRKDGAFEAIVSLDLFLQARAIIESRSKHLDETHMLELLKQILARHGILSGIIIDEEDGAPSSSAYRSRFGSLLRAYQLIGFNPKRDYTYLDINRALRKRYPDLISEISSNIKLFGGWVTTNQDTDLLTVNNEFTLSVVIAKCKPTPAGTNRWRIRLDASLEPDITIVVRMDPANQNAFDYYIFPSIDFSPTLLPLKEYNTFALDAYRTDTLELFYTFAGRELLKEVA